MDEKRDRELLTAKFNQWLTVAEPDCMEKTPLLPTIITTYNTIETVMQHIAENQLMAPLEGVLEDTIDTYIGLLAQFPIGEQDPEMQTHLKQAASDAEETIATMNHNEGTLYELLHAVQYGHLPSSKVETLRAIAVMVKLLTRTTCHAVRSKNITPLLNLKEEYETISLIFDSTGSIIRDFYIVMNREADISRLQYTIRVQEANIAKWEESLTILKNTTYFHNKILEIKATLASFQNALSLHCTMKSALDEIASDIGETARKMYERTTQRFNANTIGQELLNYANQGLSL